MIGWGFGNNWIPGNGARERKNVYTVHVVSRICNNVMCMVQCILITNISQGSVYAPSFDHGVGDPVEDDIFVGLQ